MWGAGVPGILLAAGRGRRFYEATGRNKLLVPVEGEPVVRRSMRAMLSAPSVEPVLLVVGYEGERVLEALGALREHPKLQVVRNERWVEGLSSSLRAALAHLPKDAPGVLVLPGDMPFMTSELVGRVARRFLATGKVCFPVHRGRKGHPTAIPQGLFPELQKLSGDRGALAIVRSREDAEILELSPEEERTQRDLDTIAEIRAWEVKGR